MKLEKTPDGATSAVLTPENRDKFENEFKEVLDQKFIIDKAKISITALEQFGISANAVSQLDFLLDTEVYEQ